ncbi:Inner membrane protein YnjF [Aliiroseovarius sp. xm-m-379]|nr:Inner membrane protein YnjF [Aliiroseovarius sp. xm-m-379]NRP29312.1 Inner membrane protein YnjF [Aliiroseovarius sp. xm-m-314]NRP32241.1 Inner membrane protein YnjF [Aliiroseovarius sp. xm-a-104]NRP44036.1 Inner membrane protein YnjF [Aliiroseovarius sp. xm-m-378]NRP48662.1 Inner membrane protein YnjF [Aliiroseovarius sp. xm-m-354]NRP64907.1 Inner membrane protein YnjF [Aliiroseovarius sp. xm-v-225]NRP78954.1 Inner membrane protein YnjF [Aliiroseovarius sp. xm-v-209]NRP91928.1 Inner memb
MVTRPETNKMNKKLMLDRVMRKLIDPPLNAMGQGVAALGISANMVTLIGLGLGLIAASLIVAQIYSVALVFVLLSRMADGLDGAVARMRGPTAFGGYLDIVCDFVFYGAIPFAFVLADPATNASAGAFLLLSFYANGASFLGYAVLAAKAGMETRAQGVKTLYYSNGILEGTETIVFFVILCLFPAIFPVLAWGFGILCFLTAGLRVFGASKLF